MTADSLLRVCQAQIAAGQRVWVETLRDKALAKIAAGGGVISVLASGGLNGKSFTRQTTMNAVEVAEVCLLALDDDATAEDEDEAPVASTGLDFSSLNTLD